MISLFSPCSLEEAVYLLAEIQTPDFCLSCIPSQGFQCDHVEPQAGADLCVERWGGPRLSSARSRPQTSGIHVLQAS